MESRHPFLQSSNSKFTAEINCLVTIYAKCVTGDDPSAALQKLKVQREHIAFESDTKMLAQEHCGAADASARAGAGIFVREEETGNHQHPNPARLQIEA